MSCKKCKTSKCTCETTTCINPLIYMMKNVLSLVGTSSDNIYILEILAKISGNDGDGVKPFPIKNIDYAKTLADSAAINDRTPIDGLKLKFNLELTTALIEVLTNGISISNNKNICCPDCKNGIYYLGGAEAFTQIYPTISQFKLARVCCLEHATTVETWLNVIKIIGNDFPCCNTDFNESVELWIAASSSSSAYFYLDDITTIGILESSSFNGYSGLGILFNYLQLNHPELTSEDYLNILGVIVNLGLVIQCNGCEIIMTTPETYITWLQTINGGGPVPA
jgi:hypothetical protein